GAGCGDWAVPRAGQLEAVGQVEVGLGDIVDRAAGGREDLHQVEGGVRGHHRRDPLGQAGGHAAGHEGVAAVLEGGQVGAGEELRQVPEQAVDALDEEADGAGQVERRAAVGEQPPGAALGELPRLQEHGDLGGGVDLVVQLLHLGVEAGEVEDLPGDEVGAGDVRHRRAGLLADPEQERGPHRVDQVVHDAGDDDLAPQRVRVHVR